MDLFIIIFNGDKVSQKTYRFYQLCQQQQYQQESNGGMAVEAPSMPVMER
jgi:transcription initiation factor IIF auxiliary subunit